MLRVSSATGMGPPGVPEVVTRLLRRPTPSAPAETNPVGSYPDRQTTSPRFGRRFDWCLPTAHLVRTPRRRGPEAHRRGLKAAAQIRIGELGLQRVADPRKGAVSWRIERLLVPVIAGIVAGCKSLAELERLTKNISKACARLLGIRKRVPDTTMRDLMVTLDIDGLRSVIHRQCKAAIRRKALKPEGLPIGVVSMDGRSTATRILDEHHAQTQHQDGEAHHGLVRTMTSCLVSAKARPCLDMCPIPPGTNEVGHFATAFKMLVDTYGESVFQLITYDAGGCSKENGRIVEDAQRAYLFALKGNQPELYTEAKRVLGSLGPQQAEATTTEGRGNKTVQRRLWRTTTMAGWNGWEHLRTVIRVQSETVAADGDRTVEERYFLSSLRSARLSAEQWLEVTRRHWGVENNNHWTFDAIFKEDERPWIYEPQGMLAVMALRRIAYNLLTLYRSVTQRSDERRRTPWRELIEDFRLAMTTLTSEHIAGLRPRSPRAFV